jgi:hypothetical protein
MDRITVEVTDCRGNYIARVLEFTIDYGIPKAIVVDKAGVFGLVHIEDLREIVDGHE